MADFNDPFEGRPATEAAFHEPARQRQAVINYICKTLIDRGTSPGHAIIEAERMLKRWTLDDARRIGEDSSRRIANDPEVRIMSLSGPEAIAAPLTWAHYADCHRGLCIHFSTLLKPAMFAWKIHYSAEYPILKFPRSEDDEWAQVLKVFLWKSELWSYEHEFRLLRHGHNGTDAEKRVAHLDVEWEGDVAICPPGIVEAVTLGCRMPENVRSELQAWISINVPHVKVFQASLHPTRYEVVREPL